MPYKDLEKRNECSRKWRRSHPEVSERWRNNHREQNTQIHREDDSQRRFGLTHSEKKTLHQKICDICGVQAKKMCVDHDHLFPKTHRGVLCQQCNTRLGWFEKRMSDILEYVKRGPCACRIESSTNRHEYRRT